MLLTFWDPGCLKLNFMKNIGFCSCPIVEARHLRAEATGLCKRTAVLTRLDRASDISWKKTQNFVGFSGANLRKNRPISWDFHRKKVKIRSKIGRFRGRKVKIRRKIGQFCGVFWKKVKFWRIFGANSEKNRPISREIFGENFSKKQSVKNSRFRWIFFGKFR